MRGVIINIKFETTSALFAKNNILALEVFYCKKKKNPQLLSQANKKKNLHTFQSLSLHLFRKMVHYLDKYLYFIHFFNLKSDFYSQLLKH